MGKIKEYLAIIVAAITGYALWKQKIKAETKQEIEQENLEESYEAVKEVKRITDEIDNYSGDDNRRWLREYIQKNRKG